MLYGLLHLQFDFVGLETFLVGFMSGSTIAYPNWSSNTSMALDSFGPAKIERILRFVNLLRR
jgi:hypothetical protein